MIVLLCSTNSTIAQEIDSLNTGKSNKNIWFNKPETGQSEKTQGGLLMALGGVSVIAGIIQLNREDPCDDLQGSFDFCTSNIDEVRAIGALSVGVGVVAIIYGITRYSAGAKKGRIYEEWKIKNNLGFYPELKIDQAYTGIGFRFDF